MIERLSRSEHETTAAGRARGRARRPRDLVLRSGARGAGPPADVGGVAEALGAPADDVSSPTFTIVQEYHGHVLLQHVDLYRLNAVEADDLALEDLAEHSVMAVEWPDRWSSAPEGAILVEIEPTADTERRIRISGASDRMAAAAG
jgi:tRNA threonylcarbamoyladenosine biosynthesis protein TsaE